MVPAQSRAQTIVADQAEVQESDFDPVDAVFQYSLPAAPGVHTMELALLPQFQAPGKDFAPYRATLTSENGGGLTGVIRVPVAGDLEAEAHGSLSMVVRGPHAADWAQAMSAPVNVPLFNQNTGGGRLVYWQDDLVVGVRLSPGGTQSFLDTWERTGDGGLMLRSTLSSANESFAYGALAVSAQTMVLSYDGRIRTWFRRTDNPYLWTEKSGLGTGGMGHVFLQGDRLVVSNVFGSLIYRQDPAAATGWRLTGELGGAGILTVGEDFILTEASGLVQVWERVAGTEEVWAPLYRTARLPGGNFGAATAEGMFAINGPAGLEIHERSAGGIWSRAAVLPAGPAGGLETSVAIAGDWVAVGMGTQFFPAPPGTVKLFLRSAENRSVWDSAGTLTGPGQGYGRQLIWNRTELISASYPNADEYFVVSRRFEGATTRVLDNDRTKLAVTTFTQPEPVGAMETVECFAELPLPAVAPLTVAYQLFGETAQAGADFVPASGTVVIPVGASRAAIPVSLLGDGVLEPAETFRVEISQPGQPPVSGIMRIRDTNPPAVVTASATPLLEGVSQSTVTVRQTPSTGTPLPSGPPAFEARAGGFINPPATPPRARHGVDLAASAVSLQFQEHAPEVSYQVTALQDEEEEPEDELASAVFGGFTRSHEGGTMGLAYEGGWPALPAEATGSTGISGAVAAGEWLFVLHAGATLPGIPSSDLVGCYAWAEDGSPTPVPVQYLPVEEGSGQVHLSSDGRTLAISFQRTVGGTTRGFLQLYAADGPVSAPWRKLTEWNKTTPYLPFQAGLNIVNGDMIFWGDWLMERTAGHYQWRLTNNLELSAGNAAFGPYGEYLDADGDWLLVRGPAYGEVVTYKRKRSGSIPWVKVRSFTRSRDGTLEGFGRAKIRGRSLFLLDALSRVEIHRETAAGTWQWEQTLPGVLSGAPPNYFQAMGESTVSWGGKIYGRIGPVSEPWVVTGSLPADLSTEDVRSVGGILTRSGSPFPALPRLAVLRPGLPLVIADDDSLKFTVKGIQNSQPAGMEPYRGESVARLAVWASRPSPVPFALRVRSRDNGSAVAGADYATVDFEVPVPSAGASFPYYIEFPVRIFSDRLQEGEETFELLLDPPFFGKREPVTLMRIQDYFRAGIKPTEAAPALLEPVSGSRPQAVEFLFRNAFDRDFVFAASVEAGGTALEGTDFILPAGSLTLKAGETRLRVPVTVMADALDETSETFFLRIAAIPALANFTVRTEIMILDATVPGLLADEGYTVNAGGVLTADGQGDHPPGTAANDPAPPLGTYTLVQAPAWGTVTMAANGDFTAVPGSNVSGLVSFAYQVVSVPFQRFLDATAAWKYLHPPNGANPAMGNPAFPTTWMTSGFDDSAWASGAGTLTYGGFDIPPLPGQVNLNTPPSGSRYTSYFRKTFASAAAVTVPLTISLYCDDGVVIYINGVERGRAQTTNSTTFATAPDTHTMLTGGSQTAEQEGTLQTVSLGQVPLLAGDNLLAISLHNATATSSDLGIRLVSLETGLISDPVPVSIHVNAGSLPLVGTPDTYLCPQNAEFISSDEYGAGLLDNDGLFAPGGEFYDPVMEIIAGPVSAGTLTMVGHTGHFRYTPPEDFTGEAVFEYRLRDKDGLSGPVRVTLNVQPSLPFDLWRAEALAAGSPAEADPDHDGLTTFLEYTLGSDPASGTSGIGHGFSVSPDGRTLSLILRRAADLAWRIEWAGSLDATSWTMLKEGRGMDYLSPVSAGVAVRTSTNDSLHLDIFPAASGFARRFYRLRSQRIPF